MIELTHSAEAHEQASATGRLSAEARRAKDLEIMVAVGAAAFTDPVEDDA